VEKLKSILRQTRWSLLLKAAIFAAAWYFIPSFWVFLIVALYAYFVPMPQSRTVAAPFFVLLLLAYLEPVGISFALVFGVAFFYLLLIKELVLIDRKSAHEVVILLLGFILIRDFYAKEGGAMNLLPFFYSFCTALIIGFMLSDFVRFQGVEAQPQPDSELRRPAVWLSTLIIWQFIIVGLFLPVDFIYQAVIVFLGIIPIIDFVPQYLFGDLSREKILTTASVVFSLFVFVLGSARWGL